MSNNNCLVLKLNEVVNNPNLKYFGKIVFTTDEEVQMSFKAPSTNKVHIDVTNGSLWDSAGTTEYGSSYDYAGTTGSIIKFIPNTGETGTITLTSFYGATMINFPCDISNLEGCDELLNLGLNTGNPSKNFWGDVAVFEKLPQITAVYLSYDTPVTYLDGKKVSGDIKHFGACTNLTYLSVRKSNCTGDLESVFARFIADGRTSAVLGNGNDVEFSGMQWNSVNKNNPTVMFNAAAAKTSGYFVWSQYSGDVYTIGLYDGNTTSATLLGSTKITVHDDGTWERYTE